MELNFYHYDGLQQKMSVEIINEHECTAKKLNSYTDLNLNFGKMLAQILYKKLYTELDFWVLGFLLLKRFTCILANKL